MEGRERKNLEERALVILAKNKSDSLKKGRKNSVKEKQRNKEEG